MDKTRHSLKDISLCFTSICSLVVMRSLINYKAYMTSTLWCLPTMYCEEIIIGKKMANLHFMLIFVREVKYKKKDN